MIRCYYFNAFLAFFLILPIKWFAILDSLGHWGGASSRQFPHRGVDTRAYRRSRVLCVRIRYMPHNVRVDAGSNGMCVYTPQISLTNDTQTDNGVVVVCVDYRPGAWLWHKCSVLPPTDMGKFIRVSTGRYLYNLCGCYVFTDFHPHTVVKETVWR